MKKDELISVPRCLCGAGFCRQYTESGGTEVGRKYFACPIKKVIFLVPSLMLLESCIFIFYFLPKLESCILLVLCKYGNW